MLDLILVIHEGEIVERGTHKELMGEKGFYYRLQQAQLSQDQNRLASLSAGSAVNQARSLQAQQNSALRADLMNVTDSLINTGTANMAQFAANEQQRKQANAAAGKSFAGNMLSLGGALVGSYYSPAGAQMGAGLGNMAGSYV